MLYKFCDKKSRDTTIHTGAGIEISEDQQLANELHNPITRKCLRCKVNPFYQDDVLGVDLADKQLIKKYHNESDSYCLLLISIPDMLGWSR